MSNADIDGFLDYFNEAVFRGDLPKLPNLDSSKEQARSEKNRNIDDWTHGYYRSPQTDSVVKNNIEMLNGAAAGNRREIEFVRLGPAISQSECMKPNSNIKNKDVTMLPDLTVKIDLSVMADAN